MAQRKVRLYKRDDDLERGVDETANHRGAPVGRCPRNLLRDRGGIYEKDFVGCVKGMGIEEVPIAARSPWQRPCVERVIGSIRRERLDHVIIFIERHLRRVLRGYLEYCHGSRTHLGLEKDCLVPLGIEPPDLGPALE